MTTLKVRAVFVGARSASASALWGWAESQDSTVELPAHTCASCRIRCPRDARSRPVAPSRSRSPCQGGRTGQPHRAHRDGGVAAGEYAGALPATALTTVSNVLRTSACSPLPLL